jgi:predicted kinase
MGWSEKYKKSIDCDNPKGFSQKAHCDGKKKKTQSELNRSGINSMKDRLNNDTIIEGINDPGILKCVFMAGGPGSGKSTTVDKIFGMDRNSLKLQTFSSMGLKSVNSDNAYEYLLKKNGINPNDIAKLSVDPEFVEKYSSVENPNSVFNKAKNITYKILDAYNTGRLGVIIDGTGSRISTISTNKDKMEELGYDCAMIFVYTDLETALARNRFRGTQPGGRALPDSLITKMWHDVVKNLDTYKQMFKNNFFLVDMSTSGVLDDYVSGNKLVQHKIKKRVSQFVAKPIKNPIGINWINVNKFMKSKGLKTNESKITVNEKLNLFLEKNVPTDPSKWNYWKGQAKKKFDVYPSAYANGWAAKMYKKAGGGWKTEESFISENDHEVGMAQNQLSAIIDDANSLKDKMGDMEFNLPGWIQDHISQAYNYLKQAHDGYHKIE